MRRIAISTAVGLSALIGVGASVFFSGPASSGPFGGSDASTCGSGLDCTSDTFTAADGTGPGFVCNSLLTTCLDPGPGSNNGIGTDASGRLVLCSGAAGACTVYVGATGQLNFTSNGNFTISNGAIIANGTTIFDQVANASVDFDAAAGIKIAAKTLGTCASALEGAQVRDAAAGGTTGVPTRICLCESDGAATPAYSWRNMGCRGEVTGTPTTTCPVCP